MRGLWPRTSISGSRQGRTECAWRRRGAEFPGCIGENWGSVSLHEAAADILKLTKLNWNTAAFDCREPITVAFARRVGDILKLAKGKEPALHYRYYM